MDNIFGKSEWIWDLQDGPPNTWMMFCKDFNMDLACQEANVSIAVDSKYYLWINGVAVVYEGGLNRGPKPGAGYYDMVDVSSFLKRGANSIRVLVWYWGNAGRNSIDSTRGGLLFNLKTEHFCIGSNKTWKIMRHPAYYETGEPFPSYLYAGYNIGFDARNDIPQWISPQYDYDSWAKVVCKGGSHCAPWGELVLRPIPLIKDYGLTSYLSVEKREGVLYAQTQYGCQLAPYFKINSPAGLKIDIRSDRYTVKGGPGDEHHNYNGQRIEYITKEGEQEFEALNWYFAEIVLYQIPDGVEVLSLAYRESGYDTEMEGMFHSNDVFLDTLYKKSGRTLYACIRDNYMDCPDRERGQWIGDVSSQIPQTFYLLSRSVDQLTKKAIMDFINWKDGYILRGNIPGIHSVEFASQSLNAISENGMIMEYFYNTGDNNILELCLQPMIRYLLTWRMQENGLIMPKEGRNWFDHYNYNADKPILENAWYYSALLAVIKAANFIKTDKIPSEIVNRKESIEKNFDRLFWTKDGYTSTDQYDDRANALAVFVGLSSPKKYEQIMTVLKTVKNSTPYMEGYVLEAMCKMGYINEAIERMKDRYAEMVASENTTLWEDFKTFGTYNHAWSGTPLTILAKYIAGITLDGIGWEKCSITPFLSTLSNLKIKVPTVKGLLELEFERNKKAITFNGFIPEGMKASMILNEKSIKMKISNLLFNDIVIKLNKENGIVKIEIPSGRFLLEIY